MQEVRDCCRRNMIYTGGMGLMQEEHDLCRRYGTDAGLVLDVLNCLGPYMSYLKLYLNCLEPHMSYLKLYLNCLGPYI